MKSLKKSLSLILAFIIALLTCSCSNVQRRKEELIKFNGLFYDAFDTVISTTVYAKKEAEFNDIEKQIEEDYYRLTKLYDIYNDYPGINNIKTINDNAGKEPVKVEPEIIDLLKFGKEMYKQSNSKINIAMGSVLRLWHDARELANGIKTYIPPYIPDETDLRDAALHCNIEDLIIDENNSTVYLADEKMLLDVGAVAKGFATEIIANKLEKAGHTSVLISAGGNIKTTGVKPSGDKWSVGIQDPKPNTQGGYVELVYIGNMSVVTSGVYERFFVVDDKTYHHIIDPDTLKPENRFLSISILTKDSGLADALSTSVFNMDYEEGLKFIEDLDGAECMWIFNDMTIKHSSGWGK
ncbi:MAG: FAD:protein FMN transferase [Clostridia bacterium]|nr:FAD:protein FMN transferase [Clostridia bacterium]